MKLYKGNATVIGRESEQSLYDQDLVTFEEGSGSYDHRDAAGFIRLNALRLRTIAQRKRRAANRHRRRERDPLSLSPGGPAPAKSGWRRLPGRRDLLAHPNRCGATVAGAAAYRGIDAEHVEHALVDPLVEACSVGERQVGEIAAAFLGRFHRRGR